MRYQSFFDSVLSNPLTIEQRKAVIVNEDAELVVAAAGSGKTTTIKSKVAYLVDKGMASPHQILVISFNKNVQQDLEKSLASPYPGININTFHALGLKILAEAQGQKPTNMGTKSDARMGKGCVSKNHPTLSAQSPATCPTHCHLWVRGETCFASKLIKAIVLL